MSDALPETALAPCARCGHNKTHHIYNEGPCRPGFACPTHCEAFVPTPEAATTLTDDELLSGLWWSDPEWPDYCGPLWHEYVAKMHDWNDYRKAVATVLRNAQERTDA